MSNLYFWNISSDFWDSLEDKETFDKLWIAYSRALYTAQLALYQADFGKSLSYILPYTKYVWIKFEFDSSNNISGYKYSIDDSSILSVPYLQDGINTYNNRYTEGIDYTTGSAYIEWSSSPDSSEYWAPIVYKDENRIANNWGVLIGEESSDSTEYLNAVQGAIYSYWNGPTRRDIRNGLNIFYGMGFIDRDGTVFEVDSTSITVKHGYNDYTTYTFPSGDIPAHSVGDVVKKFDALTNSIEVFDYITHPRWWRTYSIDVINEQYLGQNLSESAREEINQLSKYFTFAVVIDAEKYATLDLLIPGMAIRFLDKIKPSYTDYFFIINNNFRSIDPDDTNGDWLVFVDGTADTSTGFIEEFTINLSTTFMSNDINYMAYIAGYESNSPLSFDSYHSSNNESYDLDSDILNFWEVLEITNE